MRGVRPAQQELYDMIGQARPILYGSGMWDRLGDHSTYADLDLTNDRIGRWAPTSQVCSACGAKDGPKPLHIRAWQCQACGVWLDRDVNAAVNVAKAAGLAVTACGAQVRPGASPSAQRSEAGTLRGAA